MPFYENDDQRYFVKKNGFEVVGEAENGQIAVEKYKKLRLKI